MFQIAVCDGEPKSAGQRELIKDVCGSVLDDIKFDILFFDSGEGLVASLKNSAKYQLVFLGTCLADMSGYNAAREIKAVSPDTDIVYIAPDEDSVSEEYGELNADYFVKPLSPVKFRSVLSRRLSERFRVYDGFLNVCSQRSVKQIPLHRVYYFERSRRRLTARTKGGDIPFYGNLENLENSLIDCGFFRSHQSFLVNTALVRKMYGNKLVLSDGREVSVSRSYYSGVCGILKSREIPITESFRK